ncbi:MAG: copper chaperone PCu(A)C [Casimicrobiaceae bacterium]
MASVATSHAVRRRVMRRRAAALACVAWALATSALAEVASTNGWMRPTHAGDASADAYVDLQADGEETLIGVTTPIAQTVELVAGGVENGEYRTRVVGSFALAAHAKLRFARYGNVLRLRGITHAAIVGDSVRIELVLRDDHGRRHTANADIVVRGLSLPARKELPR